VGAVGAYQAGKLLDYLMAGNCGRLSEPDELQSLISRLQQAQKADTGQFGQLLLQRRATLFLQQGQVLSAYNDLRELLSASGQPGTQLRGAAMLASAGHYQRALELLDESLAPRPDKGGFSMQRLRDAYLQQTHYYENERQVLRETIREDLGSEQKQNEG